MKKLTTALCLLLVFAMVLSPVCYAAGENTDTLVDWDIRVTVPDGVTAVLEGNEYYIYAEEADYIPYVMLTTYDYDSSAEDFVPVFTKYMKRTYKDLKVNSKAKGVSYGDKSGWEIEYGYTVSGYAIRDRRVVIKRGDTIYLFTSKEVPELDKTVGTMLEDVVRNCVFLSDRPEIKTDDGFAPGYLYCLENGMPKYWLDFTGAHANDYVLHCYFRSSDPTFYESLYILDTDTADFGEGEDDSATIHKVFDSHGLDHSDWFKKLVLRYENGEVVMDVKRNDKTLAGGGEDNLLTGKYTMEPVGVKALYEYYEEDMLKYWLDTDGDDGDIELHAMFRSGEPSFHEEVFTIDMDTAVTDGGTITVGKIYNEKGKDVSKWFKSVTLTDVEGGFVMEVERDEKTLAGGPDDNILSGTYKFEAHTILRPLHEGPYTPAELCRWAQIYYFVNNGFYPPEADFEKNDDGSYSIHLYEIVNSGGSTHTATSAWYTVDEYGVGVDDIFGDAVILAA
ncbi:MAG: hypothetical protein K6F56_01115 [Oscillospiraceae bacterium]|nr:hypothetical protein [Oscillospiraceae bacterium]